MIFALSKHVSECRSSLNGCYSLGTRFFFSFSIRMQEPTICSAVPRFFTAYATPALVTVSMSHIHTELSAIYPHSYQSFVMFSMTAYKCGLNAFRERKEQPIVSLFLRDGLMWFAAAFCAASHLSLALSTYVRLRYLHGRPPDMVRCPRFAGRGSDCVSVTSDR